MRQILLISILMTGLGSSAIETPKVSDAKWDEARGVWRYIVSSECQKGENEVEVLLPKGYDKAKAYRVVYVLPVEAGRPKRWGDGLMEIKNLGLQDAHGVICVSMTFDTIPWYMDHASDPKIRQETYLRQVVALIEERYKTLGAKEGRLLLGFSKSGWGAVAMVLRNPDFYGAAASWDAPLMLREEDWQSFEIPKACGTKEKFAEYRLATLVGKMPAESKNQKRLVILGEKAFGTEPGKKYGPDGHTKAFDQWLTRHAIAHVYRNDLNVTHHWESGWVKGAVEELVKLPGKDERKD